MEHTLRLLHMPTRRRLMLAGAGLAASISLESQRVAVAQEPVPPSGNDWTTLQASLFGGRHVQVDDGSWLALDVSTRPQDSALVPIAIRALQAQTAARWIRRLHLVIDHNPSPMGLVVSFTGDSGRADLATSVRIEKVGPVRAIAEFNDGSLLMAMRMVKASGGFSAPSAKEPSGALASLGTIRLWVEGDVVAESPATANLTVVHPNVTGRAVDPLTRRAPKPHYVRQIFVRYADRPLLEADVDFSLSENPRLRFCFIAKSGGDLSVEVVDTEEQRASARLTAQAITGKAPVN